MIQNVYKIYKMKFAGLQQDKVKIDPI